MTKYILMLSALTLAGVAHARNPAAQQAAKSNLEQDLAAKVETVTRDVDQNDTLIEQQDAGIDDIYRILREKYEEAELTPPERQHFLIDTEK